MSDQRQTKGISALDFFCIGFGSIVGVGWALSINRWMASCGGPLPASLGYIIALVIMVPVSLCYCELAPMMPVAGGGTAYAYRAFNEKIAFISGWAAFGGFVTIIPWQAIYISEVMSILIPGIKGVALYEMAGVTIYMGQIIIGSLFSCFFFYINWKGASTSALLQRIITLVLVGAGVLAMIAALGKFDVEHLKPFYEKVLSPATGELIGFHKSFFTGSLAILATAPFFLAGFETIPQAVEDAKGDITSVGKTVVLSVGIACLFYAGLLFCLGGAMPWQEFYGIKTPAAGSLFLYAYENSAFGQTMYVIILVGAICGSVSTWNGFMMASPRLLMGMARGYMMPHILAKQNKYGTPSYGLVACFLLSLCGPFLGLGLIDPLTSFSAAGFVCSWMITASAVVSLRKKEPNAERPYRMPGGSKTAGFAAIVMALIFVLLFVPNNPVYMGGEAIILFISWMVLGVVLYLVAGTSRKAVSVEERTRSLFERV